MQMNPVNKRQNLSTNVTQSQDLKNFFNTGSSQQYQSNMIDQVLSNYYQNIQINASINLNNQSQSGMNQLYNLTVQNINLKNYRNAIFFGEKLVCLDSQSQEYIYLLGECYYMNQDYKKVHSLFVKHKVLSANQEFQILAARSLYQNKQYELCLNILNMPIDNDGNTSNFNNILNNNIYSRNNYNKLESIKYNLKAKCYDHMENKEYVIKCYKESLKKDQTNIDSFQKLIEQQLIGKEERENLLGFMNFKQDELWIKKYYYSIINECTFDQMAQESSQLNQNNPNNNIFNQQQQPNQNQQQQQSTSKKKEKKNTENLFEQLVLKDNLDILCIKAKNLSQKYNFTDCYEICLKIIYEDPLFFEIIPTYCIALLELNKTGELYYCAHNLIENYPQHPISWFSIGCYYFSIQKYEMSRKYFQKANLIDRNYIYSWIGFGHTFAILDESDQAMAVYRSIARLFPASYQANLYIGMEYLRTTNLKTALLSYAQAQQINPKDPLIYNEIGSVHYKQKNYQEAKSNYLKALQLCQNSTVEYIQESILNNLGQTYRKLKDYESAIQYHLKCLQYNSKNSSTYFSLAFVYHISGQFQKAIQYYHKSIYFKHDNQFAQDMLNRCLEDMVNLPFEAIYN